MNRIYTFIIGFISILIFQCTACFGQNFTNNTSECKLILEKESPNIKAVINVDKTQNEFTLRILDLDYHLNEDNLLINLEPDGNLIGLSPLRINCKEKAYLTPSTISRHKKYSFTIQAYISDEDLVSLVNSKTVRIILSSNHYNNELQVRRSSFDKLRQRFANTVANKKPDEQDLLYADLTYTDKNKYAVNNGVILQKIASDSPFYNSGLEQGNVIMQVDGIDVKDSNQFTSLLKERKNSVSVFTIKSVSGELKFITITIQ